MLDGFHGPEPRLRAGSTGSGRRRARRGRPEEQPGALITLTLTADRTGTGEPLVLLHGAGESAALPAGVTSTAEALADAVEQAVSPS